MSGRIAPTFIAMILPRWINVLLVGLDGFSGLNGAGRGAAAAATKRLEV
jgi:hypothetical protein